MPKKVTEKATVAWVPADHPGNPDGQAGYYIIDESDEGNHKIGRKIVWRKSNPDSEGETPDHNNNEGHYVYADGSEDDEE